MNNSLLKFFKRSTLLAVLTVVLFTGAGCKKTNSTDDQTDTSCNIFDGDAARCNAHETSDKKLCAYDAKANACIEAADCKNWHKDTTQCNNTPSCEYFHHREDKSKGQCLSVREGKGKECHTIRNADKCGLENFTKEHCVFGGNLCQARGKFDAYGFDNGGRHFNGTPYDDNGFDFNGIHQSTADRFNQAGFDREGFNRAGLGPNGRDRDGYDAFGIDANGYNRRRFRIDGTHENGRRFDNAGYDAFGYNANGFDTTNRNINGFDNQGRDRTLRYLSGHRVMGALEVDTNGLGNYEIVLPNNQQVAIQYTDRGMDQLSRFRSLPHGPANRDERFDILGYNVAGKNILGLSQADFSQHGYDAILNTNEVSNNTSGLYPNDLGQLITNFNQRCYKLKRFDPIMINENLATTCFDWTADDGRGYDFFPIVDAYKNSSYAEHDRMSLVTRVIKNGGGANDIRPIAEIKDEFKKHLKKGIYFCDKFLYAGDLKGLNNKPIKQNFAALRVKTNSRIFRDQLPQPDYKSYLDAYKRRYGDINFIEAVRQVLTSQAVLDGAEYAEANDRQLYGYIPVPPQNLDTEKRGVLARDVNTNLNAYDENGVGKDFDKSRLYLFILAMKLPRATLGEQQAIASSFAHGGVHCPDAKRDAIDQGMRLIAQDEIDRIDAWALEIIPDGNLQMVIKKKLFPIKKQKYAGWISSTLLARRTNEQLSPLSAMWNGNRHLVGMPKVENMWNFNWPIDINRFFLPELNVNQANYPGVQNNNNNVTLNGGFSKNLIYGALEPKMANKDSDAFKRIMKEVFGPLWLMIEENLIQLGGGQSAIDHPISKGLMLRLDVFEN